MAYQTEQENFWSGDFGDQYIERNGNTREFVASAIGLFSHILCRTEGIHSVIEFGPNIGLNLKAIRLLLPHVGVAAVEINHKAVQQLRDDAFLSGRYRYMNSLYWNISQQRRMIWHSLQVC